MSDRKPKRPFYLIDTEHPFYKPVGVRLSIVALAAVWAIIELAAMDMFWVVLSTATFLYVVYVLVIAYVPPADAPAPSRPPDPEDEDETADNAPVGKEAGGTGDDQPGRG